MTMEKQKHINGITLGPNDGEFYLTFSPTTGALVVYQVDDEYPVILPNSQRIFINKIFEGKKLLTIQFLTTVKEK